MCTLLDPVENNSTAHLTGMMLHRCTCAPVAFRLDITCVPVAFLIVSILTAHVTAVACPYKELSGRVCMQIQEHEDALSI